jgi:protease-4
MKKNPLLPALIFLIGFSASSFAQDFNLLNPSNELYLFSAYDEGANAFRYNPATLGLDHRINATINAFVYKFNNKLQFGEGGVAINAGHLGLAYSGDITPFDQKNELTISEIPPPNNSVTNHFTLGLGFGNKTFSAGASFEYATNTSYSVASYFDNNKSRLIGSLGFLFRPNKYLSTAIVLKTHNAFTSNMYLSSSGLLGAAFRPVGNDMITLMADFSFIPYSNGSFFEANSLKIGFEAKPYKSIRLRANYNLIHGFDYIDKYITFGIGFDLPHASVNYNNTLVRNNNTGADKFVNGGQNFSASFYLEKQKSIIPEKKRVVEITLSGSLQDYNTDDVFFGLLGKAKRSVHEVIADIDYAANDPSVKGMLLRIYPLSTGRLDISAAMEELGEALDRFKAKKKTITAYFPQDAGPAEYYIATYANDIVLPPEGLFFYGLSINVFNYKQFLQKYGVELQNVYAGKYKLTFQGILDSSSEEGKEVINRVLDIIYEKMMGRLVSARNIILDDYMKTKISQPMSAKDALRLGLVDRLGWYEDAKKVSEDHTKTSNIVKYLNRSEWDNGWGEPDGIAIIGVYASITPGESQPPPPVTLPIPYLGGGRSTGSESVVRQLEDAFANPKIKAIILRVDSGGGSALASGEINDAIIRLKKKYKKPFYVSMGGAAASGGYYVSASADKIFSDDLTITGSIGVFTTRPNVDSLLEQQKLKVENFKRGENSDITTFYRKLTPAEIEIIQGLIDFYYDRFIDAVSEGRKLSREEVEQVAQGHVWLGSDAINKGLVDEIGGLYDAIQYAKKKTGIGKRFKLVYYSVPGGESVSDVITASALQYIEGNLLNITSPDGGDDNIEIKY